MKEIFLCSLVAIIRRNKTILDVGFKILNYFFLSRNSEEEELKSETGVISRNISNVVGLHSHTGLTPFVTLRCYL